MSTTESVEGKVPAGCHVLQHGSLSDSTDMSVPLDPLPQPEDPAVEPVECGVCHSESMAVPIAGGRDPCEMLLFASPKCFQCTRHFHHYCVDIKDPKIYRLLGSLRHLWRCPDCLNMGGLAKYKHVQDRILYLQSCEEFLMKKVSVRVSEETPGSSTLKFTCLQNIMCYQ